MTWEATREFASGVVHKWMNDRCPREAASLAFQTILSIVPLLAIMLASLRAFGLMEVESNLVAYLSNTLIPISREQMAAQFLELSQNITFKSLGLVGLISTVLLSFVIFYSVENTFNHIWRVKRRRSLPKKIIVFYIAVTVIPVFLGLSLFYAAKFGFTHGVSGALVSAFFTFLAFFLAFLLLPLCEVGVVPATIGAVVSTVADEVAKLPFSDFLSDVLLHRYTGIYGAMAAIPLLFVWIYWSWVVTLLGVEISYAVRKMSDSKRMESVFSGVHECPQCVCET